MLPINDSGALEKALARRDVAALFIEGCGAHCGAIGIPPSELVRTARELTTLYGALLVIDEVITGFRRGPPWRGQDLWSSPSPSATDSRQRDQERESRASGAHSGNAAIGSRKDQPRDLLVNCTGVMRMRFAQVCTTPVCASISLPGRIVWTMSALLTRGWRFEVDCWTTA